MIAEHLPALQVVVPLLAAAVCAMLPRMTAAWFLSLVVSLLMPAISIMLLVQVLSTGVISYELGGWAPPYGIEYRVDVLNAFILVLISVIGAVVMPYAYRSVAAELPENKQSWFYCMYLLCLAGLLGITITGDAFNAFVFLEISSLSTYVLIAVGRRREALLAAFQYLTLGTIGATFYVIAVGILFTMTGTLNFVDMAERLQGIEEARPVHAALAFITVGIGLKLALFPLHAWLPNAYAFAPSVATVFLAATATKVAVYLLLRFYFLIFGGEFVFQELPVGTILVVFSVAAMFLASMVAIYQQNLKRMLAYSSVAQIGYVTLGIALANQSGLTGGIVHLFNHALMKGALFMALGCVYLRVGKMRVENLAGIGRKMPLTMTAFVIGGLSLIGVPGTVGFISKWYLVLGAFEAGMWWLAFVIVGSSVLAVLYIGRVVEAAWFREPSGPVSQATEAPLSMLIPTWILVAACIVFGVSADATAGVAQMAADFLLAGTS